MPIIIFFAFILVFIYVSKENVKNNKIREQEIRDAYTGGPNYVGYKKEIITKKIIERDYKVDYIPGIIQSIFITVFLIFVPIPLISWLLVAISFIYVIVNISAYKTGMNQLSDDTYTVTKETLLDFKVKTDGTVKEILQFQNFKYTDYKHRIQPTEIGDEYYIIQVGKKKYVYNETYYDLDEELSFKINNY